MQNYIEKNKQTDIITSGINPDKRFRSFYQNPILINSVRSNVSSLDIFRDRTLQMKSKDEKMMLKISPDENSAPTRSSNDSSSVFIKSGNKLVKVVMDSILFIYTDSKNYCSLITVDNRKLSIRSSIHGLYKSLNPDTFIQTHRSYIINWKRVDTVYESDQTLEIHGHHIPIGRTYKKNVYAKLNII